MRSAIDISRKRVCLGIVLGIILGIIHVLYVCLTVALWILYLRDICFLFHLFIYCSTIVPFWFMFSTPTPYPPPPRSPPPPYSKFPLRSWCDNIVKISKV